MYNPPPPGGYGYSNPYAAPAPAPYGVDYRANAFAPPGERAGDLPSPWIKTAKLVAGIGFGSLTTLALVFFVISVAQGGHEPPPTFFVAMIAGCLSWAFFFAYAVLNWIWTYQFWSWVPPEERWTNMWRRYMSPGTALGFTFIPYFNIYWRFVLYLGAADVLDRMRLRYNTSQESAKSLGLVAPITWLFFFPAVPIVDYLFVRRVEATAREMSAQMRG